MPLSDQDKTADKELRSFLLLYTIYPSFIEFVTVPSVFDAVFWDFGDDAMHMISGCGLLHDIQAYRDYADI